MTRSEVLKIAKYGIEKKIKNKCGEIVAGWAITVNIGKLDKLLDQYYEITAEYNAARNEEEEAE